MINFPTSLDALSNPASGDALNANGGHALQHANTNDAIEALEAKVGVDSSAVTTSLSYKLGGVTGTDKAVSLTGTEVLTNKTLTSPQINLASNATGDIYYRNGSGVFTRLAIGTSGQILQVSSDSIPEWIANPSAADASTTVKGVVEEATQAEIEAGTAAGGTSARLFINPSTNGARLFYGYAAGASGSDTYTATYAPAPTAWTTGATFIFKADVANTGAATFNPNSLGAKTIKKYSVGGKVDVITGDIIANQSLILQYDGTDVVILSSQGPRPLYATGQTSRTAGTGDGDQVIAHGLGVVPKLVKITAMAYGSTNSQLGWSVGTGTSTSDETCTYFSGNNGVAFAVGQDNANIIFVDSGSGSEHWAATLSALDATNITLTCDITGGAGTLYIQWEAYA